jgi:hypothetical protein
MMAMNRVTGKNGVPIEDHGEVWRAIGSDNVTSPQVFDYMSRDDRPTGVKYGLGLDHVAGNTRIAWVEYPKSLYTLEEVSDGDEVPSILTRCNVCNVLNQMSDRSMKAPVSVASVHRDLSPAPSDRMSLGSVVSTAKLPPYVGLGVKLLKSFYLRPTGDVAVSFGLSLLSDMLSGVFTDPSYKRALQAFSDDMIDNLDADIIDRVKQDALNIAEAAYKDGDALLSKKTIMNSMFKTRGDLRKEVGAANAAKNVIPGTVFAHSPSQISFDIPQPSGRLQIPRLFE